MAKPIYVPTTAAAAGGSSTGNDAANNNATATAPTEGNTATTTTSACTDAVDLTSVFAQLQRYKQESNGSLVIPASHPALSKIIDGLSESTPEGMESLSKKHWEDQLAALTLFKESHGHMNVPLNHPNLGNWTRIQRTQYRLYEKKLPNSLTKKRFGKLKSIGFDDDGNDESGGKKKKLEETKGGKEPNKKDAIQSLQNQNKKTVDREDNRNDGKKDDGHEKSNSVTPKEEPNDSATGQDGGNQEEQGLKPKAPKEQPSDSDNGNDGVSNGSAIKNELNEGNKKVPKKIKGKCDICDKQDGFWDHNLQKCKECGVLVHELCYGMIETDTKDPNFVCHACKAIGTKVEVNVPSKIGGTGSKMGKKRDLVLQKERPTHCLLCSYDVGVHAMHPLLDTSGPEGRQLVIERSVKKNGRTVKRKELAWAHTLCAAVICSNPSTASCVYGCDKDGNWFGDDEEEISSNEEEHSDEDGGGEKKGKDDKAKKLAGDGAEEDESSSSNEDEICTTSTCYYVIATEEGYADVIKEHRNLKCFVCGKVDKKYRIPVQCIAGEDGEYKRFKERHSRGTVCFMAMHVGCARWGEPGKEEDHQKLIEGKKRRMCFFTPGRYVGEDDEGSMDSFAEERTKTVGQCFCTKHAEDIILKDPKRKNKKPNAEGERSPARGNVMERRSPNGGTKRKQPRNKSNHEPDRGARTNPQTKDAERAQTSFRKNIATLRKQPGNKKITLKRKSTTNDEPGGVFGAGSKRPRIEFAEEPKVQYPVRGRSASALSVPTGWRSPPPNASSISETTPNKVPRPGILKKKEPPTPDHTVLKKNEPPTPDHTVSMGTSSPKPGTLERGHPMETSNSSGQVSGKRKADIVPDLPGSDGTVKRAKAEC
eukprot:CAMPEP_0183705912 /NCGR_PEP_ID=MMETSP0737-20130205/2877_1 /TAXON_ID=385413 /ORGANISM="Thalassiosira miniscula, Strain CCMP1093" /LENGTH=875 /DNA_ID=CAMNT_0025933179 /DNA_START=62 /DNA_END=2689 /DNA_ORIENTATION=-